MAPATSGVRVAAASQMPPRQGDWPSTLVDATWKYLSGAETSRSLDSNGSIARKDCLVVCRTDATWEAEPYAESKITTPRARDDV